MKEKPHTKILRSFYETQQERMYFNEIKEHTNLSISSLQNTLTQLCTQKTLKKIKQQARTYYQLADKEQLVFSFATFDSEKFRKLDKKVYVPLKEFVEKANKSIAFVILFGSTARNEHKNGSDTDLLIVLESFTNKTLQQQYMKEMKHTYESLATDINALALYPLNLKFCTLKQFKEQQDHLIHLATISGFPILHQTRYHEEIEWIYINSTRMQNIYKKN